MTGCPACGSDLKGEPIPEKYFVHDRTTTEHARSVEAHQRYGLSGECSCLPYGERAPEDRFFSRKMGYEISGVYDGVLFWGCEDCGHLWPRFSADSWGDLHFKALEHINKMRTAQEGAA